jgi:hypothetical protein
MVKRAAKEAIRKSAAIMDITCNKYVNKKGVKMNTAVNA